MGGGDPGDLRRDDQFVVLRVLDQVLEDPRETSSTKALGEMLSGGARRNAATGLAVVVVDSGITSASAFTQVRAALIRT